MMKKLALSLFKSADEKLRSLGVKHHSKPNTVSLTSTYRGALNESEETKTQSLPSKPPPKDPPPPVPKPASEKQTKTPHDPDKSHDQESDSDIPPPLYPKPLIIPMAERRIQRQTRNEPSKHDSKAANDAASLKRRSRSEGPHGRRRTRNSMHETTRSSQVPKHPSDTRHSMFTGHMSDDNDEITYLAGSDSPESDESGQKQWTKNPLMVRKIKRADKVGKNENRRSLRNSENGFHNDNAQFQRSSRDFKNVPNAKKKDIYMYNEKHENSPSSSQKAKFQKLEERRKKRIDLAVTSDEECSPQVRISRLRQRAMMSSKMFNNENEREEKLNIYPANYRSMADSGAKKDNRLSNYDDPSSMQANGYNNSFMKDSMSSSYMPVSKPQIRHEFTHSGFRENQQNGQRTIEHPHGGAVTYSSAQNQRSQQSAGVSISSESPRMRSFHEVKSNEPKQLKKAVEKIELTPRSPNSSSDDSLDELIESNIQYLESELESGKIKRQSGSFSNIPDDVVTRQSPTAHLGPLSASEEIKARLKGPSSTSRHVATVTKFEPVPKFVQRSNSYTATNEFSNVRQINNQGIAYINPNATYSPYMHRRNNEMQDDMSKSDSQLNAMDSQFQVNPPMYKSGQSFAPYPLLNKETGNVVYVQPVVYNQPAHSTSASSLSAPSLDGGMFSDVEYNIEVSERIKKWEKKVKPSEREEHSSRTILNTIQEFEHLSDTNQKEQVETPVEIRRELRLLTEHPESSGIGKLSVSLAGSSSTISDAGDFSKLAYNEPKVVSSETNLHRIFRVVQEPKRRNVRTAGAKGSQPSQQKTLPVQVASRPTEPRYAQSMSNVTFSETEMGTNMQQTWPPMSVDSDSGIRKSWRTSRYEDELNELKEMVSDNFRDLKKRFDSDVSETDTKRDSSPVRTIPIQVKEKFERGKPLVLNVESKPKSPAPPRRKHFDMKFTTPPASPGVSRVASKFETKREQVKNIPGVDDKPAPEVWSPNLESRKGLVSMERVKARTLQTIPLSEDPIWKEMEGLATFERGATADDIMKEINFDDIDALLELATKGTGQSNRSNLEVSKAEKLMTSSFSPNINESTMTIPESRPKIMPISSIRTQEHKPKTFPTPPIKPLKLRTDIVPRKSSANALDEVLEDIRNSLQKKPLSPKLMKNFDTSESNSSPNVSIQSPRVKPLKFEFTKSEKPAQRVAMKTEELENTLESTLQSTSNIQTQATKPYVHVPYIDPEFTRYPYIINGNYHLDPSLLSEKLKSTGLVADRDEQQFSKTYRSTPFASTSENTKSFPVHIKRDNVPQSLPQPKRKVPAQDQTSAEDQSVVELKGLAKEVEQKLSQIKSKIVSTDEDRLDSVLLALRKFAPMTEQKYFDVKFTPYEIDNAKKTKLERALSELEKMYEILDLNDPSLLDRASRMEETTRSVGRSEPRHETVVHRSVQPHTNSSVSTPYRKSQIEEVERQTQHEFEDITKSFQVLIDEVTRQCHAVAQGSKRHAPEFSYYTDNERRYNQPQEIPVRPQPPHRQTPTAKSQRSLQDSYNNAIKELESVAKGPPKSVQSSVYVNLGSSTETKPVETKSKDAFKNLNIQIQSRAVTVTESRPVYSDSKVLSVSPTVKSKQPIVVSSKMNISPTVDSGSQQSDQTEPKLRGNGRFRRRTNPEHRKSMPVFTRNVETQTAETQTETSPDVREVKEILKLERKSSLHDSSDSSGVKIVGTRKLSGGIAKMVELFSSSEDERNKNSKLKHSHSAPDLTLENNDTVEANKLLLLNIEKRKSTKSSTPRSVKHKYEAKARSRSTRDEGNQDDMTSSVTSEDGVLSPTSKPPVYPNWKYPGLIDSPPPFKKTDKHQSTTQETTKAASDTERGPVNRSTEISENLRRRTRSASDQENTERPRSFHELMATFENDPKRLEKIRMSGLRKCASEDSMFTDLVLQKIYHSDTDLHKDGNTFRKSKSGSGLKLALEIHVKEEK